MSNNNNNNNDIQGRLQIYSEHKLRAENLPFDIDVWYPVIKDFTYYTIFRPLSRQEAFSIMSYYEQRFLERKVFTEFDVKILNNLENDLDKLIKQHFNKYGAFLRLCGRSPKDAEPLDIESLKQKYKRNLNDLINNHNYDNNANTKLIAISKVNWMCVKNGKEAMSLLLTSERVFTDLHDWIKYGEPEQIVLRDFDPELSMDYEFRAFINNNSLNAISQYDHYAIFPHVKAQKQIIQEKIFSKWKQIHPFVGQKSYVMDFFYSPISQSVTVIELSPFLPCTGAALFHWEKTKDIMENGPFEFRFNNNSHPQLDDIVESNWDLRWNQKIPKYYELYKYAYIDKDNTWYNYFSKVFISFYNNYIKPEYLFVYGTLKQDFHWNKKYLYNNIFIGKAHTQNKYPLILGDCNVPYILPKEGIGYNIIGEIWKVDIISLQGMDDYEGVNKGYYSREKINVLLHNNNNNNDRMMKANIYFKLNYSDDLLKRTFYNEYSLEHHKNYHPIMHIKVKQQKYLGVNDELHQL